MTEQEWLADADPTAMIRALGGQLSAQKRRRIAKAICDRLTDRKLRLFACACCRRIWDAQTPEADKRAVEVAEMYADREMNREELDTALTLREPPVEIDVEVEGNGIKGASEYLRFMAHQAVTNATGKRRYMAYAAACAAGAANDKCSEQAAQCDLLRCVFGNPFRPIPVDRSWLTTTVVLLAKGIYDDRAFDRFPILADALQDAGCNNEKMLAHCRYGSQHVRGCWVVDGLLGKE